jgi:hypothetical protein
MFFVVAKNSNHNIGMLLLPSLRKRYGGGTELKAARFEFTENPVASFRPFIIVGDADTSVLAVCSIPTRPKMEEMINICRPSP